MAAVAAAKSVPEMWSAVGRDAWVVVPVASLAARGEFLDGTRLTLVKLIGGGQPNTFEFAIRTPVTPPRWATFNRELAAAWGEVERAYG